jgi:hypothetical protein
MNQSLCFKLMLTLPMISALGCSGGMKSSNGASSSTAASTTSPTPAPAPAPAPSSFSWKPIKIGAGGWLVGMDIASDGTKVVRTDTYGAYLWNGNQWQQLVTATSMPSTFLAPGSNSGVYEIRIAPSNTSIFYMTYLGYVFKSSNRGTTWTKTAFSQVSDNSNDNYRMTGHKMAIDPNNSNVVYVGTTNNGVFLTTDGGMTYQSVSSVPVGGAGGITGLAFDPSSGSTSGRTNTIYAVSYGKGVYQSTNAGASWAALTGGPTTADQAIVVNGAYYVASGSALMRYKAGTWSQLLTDSGQGVHTISIDPFNTNHLVVGAGGGVLQQSLDGGTTWTGWNWNSTHMNSTDIPWLMTCESYMSSGDMAFDPLVQNKLWAADGIGVWNATIPLSSPWSTNVVWNSQSVGIEQLVADEIVVPPGGKPVVASWDRPFFYVNNPAQFPSYYSSGLGSGGTPTITAGWSIDYASTTPSFLVGLADWWGVENTGYSSDGGQTWHKFASTPPGASSSYMGGTIAASTPANIIWAPANNQQPYYTLNGGTSWNPISLPGVSSWSGFDFAYYLVTRTVIADRVTANTFYLFFSGKGLYKTTNGGTTWVLTHSGDITSFDGYNAKILSVPGQTGSLFFTGGPQSAASHPVNEPFMRSIDGGTTWTAVANVEEVLSFGFGAPKVAGGYPAIFIVGWVNNVYGIWQSDNNAQSWTQIGTYPVGSLDQIRTLAGDPNQYGVVYVGFSGSGYAYFGP